MYKLICFDLDGTLLDTVPDIRNVLNLTLKNFSLPEVSYEQTKAFVGNGAFRLVERAAGNIDNELLNMVYRDYVERFSACDNSLSKFYPQEEGVLRRLTSAGVKLAIVTNKPQRATRNVYEKYFTPYNFVAVCGQGEGVPLKPDPTSLLKIIEGCRLKKEECLFVGDGETDVQTAANAGVDCVSVLWGYRSRSALEEAGAKKFAQNYPELENFIFT